MTQPKSLHSDTLIPTPSTSITTNCNSNVKSKIGPPAPPKAGRSNGQPQESTSSLKDDKNKTKSKDNKTRLTATKDQPKTDPKEKKTQPTATQDQQPKTNPKEDKSKYVLLAKVQHPDPQKRVEHLKYFYGLIGSKDAKRYLTEPGDFLLRAKLDETNSLTRKVIICLLSTDTRDKNMKQYGIELRSDGWRIGSKLTRPTMDELIKHLVNEQIAIDKEKQCVLRRAVERPVWIVDSSLLSLNEDKPIGKGQYGSVYLGVYKPAQDKQVQVAVKQCKDLNQQAMQAVYEEALRMADLRHRNIVAFVGLACDMLPFLILTAYCSDGALDSYIRRKKPVALSIKHDFMRQIAEGMRYLTEDKKIVHRDLATRNCLVHENVIKICDFGLSRSITKYVTSRMKSKLPVKWMAPETFEPNKDDQFVFTTKSDVWAFGVTVWELLTDGEEPWKGVGGADMVLAIKGGALLPMKEGWPPDLVNVMRQCFQLDPAARPGFGELALMLRAVDLADQGEKTQYDSDESTPSISVKKDKDKSKKK